MPDFPNPQQDPGMERRLLLVFALTVVVILLFQPILKRYMPQAPAPPAQTQNQAPVAAAPAAMSPAATQPPVPVSASAKLAASEEETVVDNDLYQVTFTNRGAQIKSWVLKQFQNDAGRPLDLVNGIAAAKYGYPLSLWTYDETLRNKLNSVLYVAGKTGNVTAPAEITFEYVDQDVAVRKTVRFDHSY